MLPRHSFEESSLDIVTETLRELEPAAQGAFCQKFLKNLVGLEVSEEESVAHWQQILAWRRDLCEKLGRPVSLRTAVVDYVSHSGLAYQPVLLEYEELKRLRHDVATDPLTGLSNRRTFDEQLEREITRSQRHGVPLTLVFLDLRNFKKANDTYGHAVGDAVLRRLARVFDENIRASDYSCRVGGDEFALILPQSEAQSTLSLVQRTAQRFIETIQTLAPEAGIVLDFGLASYPGDAESATSLFKAADADLYTRRQRGFDPTSGPTAGPARAVPEQPPRTTTMLPKPLPEIAPTPPPRPPDVETPRQWTRRHERISLEKINAYGVLQQQAGRKQVRVLDVSFGGVGFLMDEAIDLPEKFFARLHVPILPEADFKLRRVYSQRLAQGLVRVGCRFDT